MLRELEIKTGDAIAKNRIRRLSAFSPSRRTKEEGSTVKEMVGGVQVTTSFWEGQIFPCFLGCVGICQYSISS